MIESFRWSHFVRFLGSYQVPVMITKVFRKGLLVIPLLIMIFCSCAPPSLNLERGKSPTIAELDLIVKTTTHKNQIAAELRPYLDNETNYSIPNWGNFIVQNGYPKGGGYLDVARTTRGYFDPVFGTQYSCGIFWTRMINQSDIPIEIDLSFSGGAFSMGDSPDAYYRLFLIPETMTLEKLPLYNYGVTNLKPFLDNNFHKLTYSDTIIPPQGEYGFFVALLLHAPSNGAIRTSWDLEGEELFYRVDIPPYGNFSVSAGELFLRN